MSNVRSLVTRAAIKCKPGNAAFHPVHGWCTVTVTNGLMREIEVLSRRSAGQVSTEDLPCDIEPSEMLEEETLTIDVYDVHVNELEDAMPPSFTHRVDKTVANFDRKVLE